MLYFVFFSISLLIFLVALFVGYSFKERQSKALHVIFLGVLGATFFLVFPLYLDMDVIDAFVRCIFYVISMITMSGDFSVLQGVSEEFSYLYKYLLYLYSILVPLLTVSVIISFIGNKMNEIRSFVKTRKTVHIFSSVNERSVILAESLKSKDNVVIFCDTFDRIEYRERISLMNGILLKKNINNVSLKRYLGEVKIYFISDDEDLNLNSSLSLIEKEKNCSIDLTFYIFSSALGAQIILDSVDKNRIKTILIDEVSQMVYHVLDESPLYKNCVDKKISVLLMGAGRIGMEFLKTINWCGQMHGYQLEIHVVDKNASMIESALKRNFPELGDYSIYFYEVDVVSNDIYKVLEKWENSIHYVVVALGEDNLNLQTSIFLREFFLKKDRKPLIHLVLEDKDKKRQVLFLKNERGISYEFYPFGCIEDLYGSGHILNDKIERLSKLVHLAYNPLDTELQEYYRIEYYKKSSRAFALHIQYKLYSILGDEWRDISKVSMVLQDKGIMDLLACSEHDRWMAYVRCEGYVLAKLSDVERYFSRTHHHVDHLAKMHPALVPFKDLDKVSLKLSDILKKPIDLKSSDYDIISKIPDMLRKEDLM